MSVTRLVQAHYREQQLLARSAARHAQQAWRQIDRSAIAESWRALLAAYLRLLLGLQAQAARRGAEYVPRVVREAGTTPRPYGRVRPDALVGVASDGRDLESLLTTPLGGVFGDLRDGADVEAALEAGLNSLVQIVATQIADAGRVATSIGISADEAVSGYVRIVTLPACGRCIVLAGREYSHSTGFQRHPRCDCTMRPLTREEWDGHVAGTDPKKLFEEMTPEQQDKAFTRSGARAIRDHDADIGQVVNARRGMSTAAGPGGRAIATTTEGTTVRGLAGRRLGDAAKRPGDRYRRARAPRLMPEQIFAEAERLGWDRDEVNRQLKRFSYIY